MLLHQFLVRALPVAVIAASAVCAQDYPHKPVRIVTTPVGSGNDFLARLMAQGLGGALGQQVTVENRSGGVIPAETVAKAPPDGYTLLVAGDTLWIVPLLQKTAYDPVGDFAPITIIAKAPTLLVVHPSMPVKTVKELIALARARPGVIDYAAGSTGSSNHLAAELFKTMAGVNMVRIPYGGTGPALNALLGGEVQVSFANAAAVMTHVKSGRIRALAVTTAEPSTLFPGLPTVAAAGLTGFESGTKFGIFAPAKTPATVVQRLNQELLRILGRADVKEKLTNFGLEAVGNAPQAFATTLKSEMATWGKVIKNAGIRAD
jgi:tripartite-type tricarboxylate transporter receptor subunit TctC